MSQPHGTPRQRQFIRHDMSKRTHIRKRFSQPGSYFGIRPDKLSNGKLRWPADAVQQLFANSGQ